MQHRTPVSPWQSRRGATLIVALLICAIIALMLGSYLSLSTNSTRQAFRSFQGYAAINLVEAGAEEALWSFNRDFEGHADAWAAWSTSGPAAWRKFTDFDFTANTSGWVKVYVGNHQPAAKDSPKIVMLASVNPASGAPVTRMMEITLRKRSFFANGLVAKNSITFNGTLTTVDSWNSDPDNNGATAPIDFDVSVRNDNGTVASASVQNTAAFINQADIWGYVFTGGAQPQVGTQGSIRGSTTPTGVDIDPGRIATDFNADFQSITAPDDGTFIGSVGSTLGTTGLTTKWRCPSITLTGSQTLTIYGDVTLTLTAPSGTSALSMAGNAKLVVTSGSSLKLYAEGDVKIAGKGVANANIQPLTLQLWGTNPTLGAQIIHIAGNGDLRAIVYAPNADTQINGNGNVMGSIIANTITLTGNAAFHYDESLADYGDNTGFSVSKWRELTTAAERQVYEAQFDGW
ncbi:MAG: hypothetical protein K9N01_02325 [Cephaloticoccus sp.]|nr:hypothetical protein [Cephaloticoccus sp.]